MDDNTTHSEESVEFDAVVRKWNNKGCSHWREANPASEGVLEWCLVHHDWCRRIGVKYLPFRYLLNCKEKKLVWCLRGRIVFWSDFTNKVQIVNRHTALRKGYDSLSSWKRGEAVGDYDIGFKTYPKREWSCNFCPFVWGGALSWNLIKREAKVRELQNTWVNLN